MWWVFSWLNPSQRDEYALELTAHFRQIGPTIAALERAGFTEAVQNSFALVQHKPLPEALRDHVAWLHFLAHATGSSPVPA